MLTGTANPMFCAGRNIAVLMPMTSPLTLISGPPELPKLIAASVWMKFSKERVAASRRQARALLGGDDADGDGLVEVERVADRHDPLADAELVGIAQRQRRQALLGVDLEQREVRRRIAADELRRVRSLLLSRTSILSAPSMTWLFVTT